MIISLFSRQAIKTPGETDTPGEKSDHESGRGSEHQHSGGDCDEDNRSNKSEKFVAKSGEPKESTGLVNRMQIEVVEEPGLLDTSRANDFDGSFLKVAEFESEHHLNSHRGLHSSDDEQYEYVHDLGRSSMATGHNKRDEGSYGVTGTRNILGNADTPIKGHGKVSVIIEDQQSNLKSFRMQSILEHKHNALEKSNMKNTAQMTQRITDLEQKVYQLESEKQALESCLNKMQDDLVNAKDNEEDIKNQFQDLNDKLLEYEDQLDGKDLKISDMEQ